MIRPDMFIVFGPDGWADISISMTNAKELADAHFKEHPIIPYE
jgi:hypothetical protein